MKCFYHCDMDGRCSAAIVARMEMNYDREDYFEVNYVQPLPLDKVKAGERVYFVDYSFKADTIHQMGILLARGCDVIWIDHHTSSLNLLKDPNYEWVKDVKGLISDEGAGAVLTYMYMLKVNYEEVPYFIKLVSDYDTWSYKFEPETTWFKLGLETEDFDALDAVWKDLFSPMHSEHTRSGLIEKGKIIKEYIDKDNTLYRNRFEYEIELCGLPCKVINKSSNSWIFGEHYYQFPMVMVYAFDGEKVTYSIFSSDKMVDCSKIAESYSGGGHKGAAGFSSDEILFKKGGKYGYGPFRK